ncbi:hypothetical protein BACCAP_00638 [Pseudoflavonifractor capillosus ATCC 29799]|uniref:Uncharacterized protein n=1 Tax=Pseudoflavonifractor capillosus ATCC 29799 TaxID=411467 RepID=A6NR14_9FIRM|nr:hypothetical protein BACCAP_00638 [Pseudoflavonifractor capillosus ATCC 29799]
MGKIPGPLSGKKAGNVLWNRQMANRLKNRDAKPGG